VYNAQVGERQGHVVQRLGARGETGRPAVFAVNNRKLTANGFRVPQESWRDGALPDGKTAE
jgi:hypothetical protein